MHQVYKNTITVNEVNELRKAVGFLQLHPDQVKASLDGSAFIVSAYEDDRNIGMARLIWDGASVAMIHDILVVPEYQMKNIKYIMINQIFDFLHTKLKPGFGIQIDIRGYNDDDRLLYEKLGFQISTHQQRGTPMHICLTEQIELTDEMFKQCEFKIK